MFAGMSLLSPCGLAVVDLGALEGVRIEVHGAVQHALDRDGLPVVVDDVENQMRVHHVRAHAARSAACFRLRSRSRPGRCSSGRGPRGRIAEKLARADFEQHPKVRILARIRKLVLDDIPSNPAAKEYEQGNTLGAGRRHWRRAKFNQRFRLFFRFRSKGKLIVYAWMNDEHTMRARGARNDVYAVFEQRLKAGDPPDDWDGLLAACE